MKKTRFPFLLCLILCVSASGQTDRKTDNSGSIPKRRSDAKRYYIKDQNYLSANSTTGYGKYHSDSLAGFNEITLRNELLGQGVDSWEIFTHIQSQRRAFIKDKYGLNTLSPTNLTNTARGSKGFGGGTAVINATPCVNEDFESTPSGVYTTSLSVAGWTLENRYAGSSTCGNNWSPGSPNFSIVSTPFMWPIIGPIPHSPLGGTQVARLNNSVAADYDQTRISQSFIVSPQSTLYQFAYAGFWQDPGSSHSCCQQPGFTFKMYDCSGNPLACSSVSLASGTGCQTAGTTYTTESNGDRWTNWQVQYVDLTPYIGVCVTVEFMTMDCSLGGHYSTSFFDSKCGGQFSAVNPALSAVNTVSPGPVSFCAGSGVAHISGPIGYASYQWVAPTVPPSSVAAPQGTMASLTITNPIPGSIYTVQLTSPSGCQYVATNTIVFTQVSVAGIGASSSCPNGANGTATVVANGSGAGYSYQWINATASLVSTASVALNLAPGPYTVNISGLGPGACGTATASTSVNIASSGVVQLLSRPHCGSQAFFTTPAGASNVQWYNGSSPIPSPIGTANTYTLNNPAPAMQIVVSYDHLGCRDSVNYFLTTATPGSVNAVVLNTVCPGATNGNAIVTLSPSPSASSGSNKFDVFSPGPSPYSVSIGPGNPTTVTITNLPANQTFTVSVFDGICLYGTSFSLTSIIPPFDYTVGPNNAIVCQGNSVQASLSYSGTAAYTFSWEPASLMAVNNATLQNPILTPTVFPNGSAAPFLYTIAVTPTTANCPLVKTFTVQVANLVQPFVKSFSRCENGAATNVTVNPTGGVYYSTGSTSLDPISQSGVLTPSLALIGANTFTYALVSGTCSNSSLGQFTIVAKPQVSISGRTLLCAGEPATLTAHGAHGYNWTPGNMSGAVLVLPAATAGNFTVSGLDLFTGCSNDASISIAVENCTGIHELSSGSGRPRIYPNPGKEELYFECGQAMELEIRDQLGRKVLEAKLQNGTTTIDLKSLSRGIYYFYAMTPENTFISRLVLSD